MQGEEGEAIVSHSETPEGREKQGIKAYCSSSSFQSLSGLKTGLAQPVLCTLCRKAVLKSEFAPDYCSEAGFVHLKGVNNCRVEAGFRREGADTSGMSRGTGFQGDVQRDRHPPQPSSMSSLDLRQPSSQRRCP